MLKLEQIRQSQIWQSPIWRWGRWSLIGFLALRLIYSLSTFPNPDEAYYWLWGQHPGWSYYDHPGFQAWVQGLIAAVMGRSTIALRLANLISTSIIIFLYYKITSYLYGKEARDRIWVVLLLVASSPLFFLFLAMAWSDHWLIAFVLLSCFYFVRFTDRYIHEHPGKTRDLMSAALFLGIAGLCKYNAVFVGLAMVATTISHRSLRQLWREPRSYLAVTLVLVILSPILIWNLQHDMLSFRFYGTRTTTWSNNSLDWLQPMGFLGLSALILGPVQAWAIARQAHSPKPKTSQTKSTYPILAWWLFGISTTTFTMLSTFSASLYYWNILAFPLLFPLLTDQFYNRDGYACLKRRRFLATAQGMGLFAAVALILHYNLIPLTTAFSIEDGDSTALYGWPELSALVTKKAAGLKNPLLLTTDYRSASALAYTLDKPDVVAVSGRLDQFDVLYKSSELEGRDAILIGENWHPICALHLQMFEDVEPAQTIKIKRFGKTLQTYTIVIGRGFKAGPPKYTLSPEYPLSFSRNGEQCSAE